MMRQEQKVEKNKTKDKSFYAAAEYHKHKFKVGDEISYKE